MSTPLEKQLISSFAKAWNESASPLLGRPSALTLLALREVTGDSVASALAVAGTWSSAFVVPSCGDALPGVMICLFKSEDSDALDRFVKESSEPTSSPASRMLVTATLAATAIDLSESLSISASFEGEVTHLDLATDESRLAKMVGDTAWVGTFSLTVGDDLSTQVLLLYAPQGSVESLATAKSVVAAATATASPTASAQQTTSAVDPSKAPPAATRRVSNRREEAPRNIERLLDVEMEVIVRFGLTSAPLRDVVRMGTGTVIELDRAVDEPVELLINGRPLARGEVVVVDGYYGVRITEITGPTERALTLL